MNIFPAIDILDGKAVRLLLGDYNEVTVYNEHPEEVAAQMEAEGAKYLHLVDLGGAKDGSTPAYECVKRIRERTKLFIELGGGIRSLDVIERYISLGVDRVILGTAALTDPALTEEALKRYKDKIAVGVDLRGGYVAIRGWREGSGVDGFEFCKKMEKMGVKTIICTDISKDGAMKGANHELYERLSREVKIDLIASGGVSSLDDVRRLRSLGMYGAIIGKAYYTGAITISDALEAAK